jgi:hypothetical protein
MIVMTPLVLQCEEIPVELVLRNEKILDVYRVKEEWMILHELNE